MFDFEKVLVKYPNGVLATEDGGKVKTRVFQFLFCEGQRVYFCTSSEKPVYDQLQKNPETSFCTYSPDYAPVLSVNGPAVFVEDMGLNSVALEENPGIKGLYQSPENPVFKLFYIDVKELETFSFAEGPKTYTL